MRLLGGSEMYGRQTEKARTCVVHPRAGGGGGGRDGGNGGGGDRKRRRGGGGGDWRGRGGGGGGDRIVCGGGGAAETRRRDETMSRRVTCDFISVTRDTERCGGGYIEFVCLAGERGFVSAQFVVLSREARYPTVS